MSGEASRLDFFPSHSGEDKTAVRAFSPSASNGERIGVRCQNRHFAAGLVAATRPSGAFLVGRQTGEEKNGRAAETLLRREDRGRTGSAARCRQSKTSWRPPCVGSNRKACQAGRIQPAPRRLG